MWESGSKNAQILEKLKKDLLKGFTYAKPVFKWVRSFMRYRYFVRYPFVQMVYEGSTG